LDLVEEEDQMTHTLGLTDDLQVEDVLNVFSFDSDFLENEAKYAEIKKEILGGESDDEEEEEDEEEVNEEEIQEKARVVIEDQTNTNLVNLRRAIYLTIMSSLNFEECCHKLLKLDIPQGNIDY
jgi:pre-mRNA-splicing factor CWC22